MANSYLDKAGLTYFWGKIKTLLAGKADNTAFTGATSSADGDSGIVPAPSSGDQSDVLCGDGTWVKPLFTITKAASKITLYLRKNASAGTSMTSVALPAASTSEAGLLTSSDKTKLDGATATPTASKISKFDSSAHMNSTDMTTSEVTDFVNSLDAVSSTSGNMYAVSKDSSFGATIWTFNVYKYVSFVIVYYNIQVPALSAATEYTMCNISNVFTPAEKMNFTIAGQSAGRTCLLQVYDTGRVSFYSVSAVSAGEFIRGTLVIPILT